MSTGTVQQRIVVGVDGSTEAAAALAWAVDEARLREALLSIVHVFPVTSIVGATADEYLAQITAEARALLEGVLEQGPSLEGLALEEKLVPGSPSEVLVDASDGAALLVVGSRGRGGLRGLVLGSVSSQCAQYAHCPVVVVRANE